MSSEIRLDKNHQVITTPDDKSDISGNRSTQNASKKPPTRSRKGSKTRTNDPLVAKPLKMTNLMFQVYAEKQNNRR